MANNNDKFISRENAKTLWGYMIDLLTGKQNKLTFDETPTQSSDNPVKSGGIFTALAGKGTYSKPQNGIPKTDLESAVQTSLGLADSALQSETDPTVPSWAKQTNKPAYNSDEISDDNRTHKFATSAQLTQIQTNKNNALYALNRTGKNYYNIKNDTSSFADRDTITIASGSKSVTFVANEDGSITISGASEGTTPTVVLEIGDLSKYAGMYLSGAYSNKIFLQIEQSASPYDLYGKDTGEGGQIAASLPEKATFFVRINSNYTITDPITIYPMISETAMHEKDPSYVSHALPNRELTVLESEDRAALAEEIDAGAKSLVPMTWTNADPFADIHMTKNSDGSITVKATNTAATRIVSLSTNINNYLTVGKRYVLSGCDGGDYSNHYGFALSTSNYTGRVFEANGSEEFTYASEVVNFTLVVRAGESWTKTFKPMICTLADWKISSKFAPYRLPYQTLGNLQWKTYEVNLASVSFVKSGGGLYYYYFSVTNDFSEVLSVTIAGFSATANKGFSAYMEAGKIGLMVYDATDPQSLVFSNGSIWLRVVGFK